MGGANNICSDKTGTLTKNLMTVTRFWGQGALLDKFETHDKTLSENFKTLLASAVSLNSDANPKVKRGGFEQLGNKTECALLAQSGHLGMAHAIRPSHTRFDGDLVIALASGRVDAHLDRLRVAESDVVARAIRVAVGEPA